MGAVIGSATVVIEQTGKKWKRLQVLGTIGAITGIPIACAGFASDSSTGGTLGIGAVVLGFIVFLIGRIGAWWHHG
ncbi:MAG: hypothetical protein AABZ30_11145 [Myxococcota bacterium]